MVQVHLLYLAILMVFQMLQLQLHQTQLTAQNHKQKNLLDTMHLYNTRAKTEQLLQKIMKQLLNQFIQMHNQLVHGVVKMMKRHNMVLLKLQSKPISGSTLTTATKESIKTQLKRYNVVSVRPEIVDPETTTILLTSNVKYNENATTKTSRHN